MESVCNQSLFLLPTKPLLTKASSSFLSIKSSKEAKFLSTSHSSPKQIKKKIMSNTEASPNTAIAIRDAPIDDKGTAPLNTTAHSAPVARAPIFGFLRKAKGGRGWKRGIALFDFVLRLLAIGATLAAAITMATTDETLPFFTAQYQFHAEYSDLPSLPFFVIGNAIAAGYLVLSLPFSIAGIICPHIVGLRLLLFIFDLVMVALTTAAGSAAASIVYLAHSGNSKANWVAICLRFDGFCEQISGAVVASFVGTIIIMLMVVMSALALRKH